MKPLKYAITAASIVILLVLLILKKDDYPKSQHPQTSPQNKESKPFENRINGKALEKNEPLFVYNHNTPISKKVLDSHMELRPDGSGWKQTLIIEVTQGHRWLRVENNFEWNDTENDYTLVASTSAVADEILVKLDDQKKLQLAIELSEGKQFEIAERLSNSGWHRVILKNFDRVSDLPKALRFFRKEASEKILAEPDYIVRRTDTLPNDNFILAQYYLNSEVGINARAGWDKQSDASNIKVAVIDSGIQTDHEDLKDNLWENPNEQLDGIDNDNNGYVDDTYGVDVIESLGNPSDESGHGTQVSGLIGAEGNNGIGIAGVAWKVQLMVVRFLNGEGVGTISDALKGIQYAIDNEADILNLSWGGSGRSQALEDLLIQCNEEGILCVTSAGNSGVNIDSNSVYPASFNLPNLITVGATDDFLNRSAFSNWGPNSVDIMAPGNRLLSTHIYADSKYFEFTGTSASAPLVAGVAALVKARFGDESPQSIKSRILLSARLYNQLAGITATGGIVDLSRALNEETNAPANDDFANAFSVGGPTKSFQSSLSLGSIEAGEPNPQNFADPRSLWF